MTRALDYRLVRTYLHISPEGVEHPVTELPATGLFDEDRLRALMVSAGELVQAEGLKLQASFVGTSLCNLCITKLIFLAQDRVMLDLSLDDLTFQVETHDDHAHLGYRIDEVRHTAVPEADEEAAVLADWERYITTWITPAVEAVARAAGEKPAMIGCNSAASWRMSGTSSCSTRRGKTCGSGSTATTGS